MPDTPDEVLKTPAAADLLGINYDTLVKGADEGTIPHWKTPGGHRRFLRSALIEWRDRAPERAEVAS